MEQHDPFSPMLLQYATIAIGGKISMMARSISCTVHFSPEYGVHL
jgi:hypothetical protein